MLFSDYDPSLIPYQKKVLRDVRRDFDYSKGFYKLLFSGAVGSGKTTILAHLIVTHCLMYDNACVGIGRLSLKYLKDTLFQEVLGQIGNSVKCKVNTTSGNIEFPNGSKIISFSWSDKQYKKVRSYAFSAFAIEELTETKSSEIFKEITARMGRIQHIPECWIACATNPDEPSHWVYKEFIAEKKPNTKVYFSKTADNKLLPPNYEKQLRDFYDPLMARRMLEGEWLSIMQEAVYHQFTDHNIIEQYRPKFELPIWLSWDFNIGHGKPMSVCAAQFVDGKMMIFDEVILAGMRTKDTLEELSDRGYFKGHFNLNICADATGSSRDTRGVQSDIDIIQNYLSNLDIGVKFNMMVPRSNPAVRLRHNLVNSYLLNANGERRLFVAKNCKTTIEGLRLTKLKSGSNYVEDDSDEFQHITTSVGYALFQMNDSINKTGITQGRR